MKNSIGNVDIFLSLLLRMMMMMQLLKCWTIYGQYEAVGGGIDGLHHHRYDRP